MICALHPWNVHKTFAQCGVLRDLEQIQAHVVLASRNAELEGNMDLRKRRTGVCFEHGNETKANVAVRRLVPCRLPRHSRVRSRWGCGGAGAFFAAVIVIAQYVGQDKFR